MNCWALSLALSSWCYRNAWPHLAESWFPCFLFFVRQGLTKLSRLALNLLSSSDRQLVLQSSYLILVSSWCDGFISLDLAIFKLSFMMAHFKPPPCVCVCVYDVHVCIPVCLWVQMCEGHRTPLGVRPQFLLCFETAPLFVVVVICCLCLPG